MTRAPARWLAALAALALGACSTFGKDELPEKAPPLVDMEEPVALHEEPDDEAARKALPLGSFTGISVAEARRSLGEPSSQPGVRVARVAENSPADAAGVEEDDLVLAARGPSGAEVEIRWPSEWRKFETDTPPDAEVVVVLDRAGDEREVKLRTLPRVRAGERTASDRYREEQRTGAVFRTATEVEARAAGLGAGGGAVIVGLSAASPWRAAGLRFEDLIVSVDGTPVAHPQQLIEVIRSAPADGRIAIGYVRGGAAATADVPVSRRAQRVRRASIPLLYSYESDRGMTETSVLMGLFRKRSTEAAWEWRLFWLIDFSGGDADRLVEVEP